MALANVKIEIDKEKIMGSIQDAHGELMRMLDASMRDVDSENFEWRSLSPPMRDAESVDWNHLTRLSPRQSWSYLDASEEDELMRRADECDLSLMAGDLHKHIGFVDWVWPSDSSMDARDVAQFLLCQPGNGDVRLILESDELFICLDLLPRENLYEVYANAEFLMTAPTLEAALYAARRRAPRFVRNQEGAPADDLENENSGQPQSDRPVVDFDLVRKASELAFGYGGFGASLDRYEGST